MEGAERDAAFAAWAAEVPDGVTAEMIAADDADAEFRAGAL